MTDAAALLPIVTDATTMKYTSGLIANDLEVVKRWLSARALGSDVLNFVVTLKDDGPPEEGQVVGIMGSYHFPEIGYLMNRGMFFGNFLYMIVWFWFHVLVVLVTITCHQHMLITLQTHSPRRQRLRHRSPPRLPPNIFRPRPFAHTNSFRRRRRAGLRLRASRNRRRQHRQSAHIAEMRFHARRDDRRRLPESDFGVEGYFGL
jgi:hypothetical protein